MDYRSRHQILGCASDYSCELALNEDCKGRAYDWALNWPEVDHAALQWDEKIKMWWSDGMDEDYIPACRPCHLTFDGKRKLSDADVAAIRERYTAGQVTQRTLGRQYGVDPRTISRIVRFEYRK